MSIHSYDVEWKSTPPASNSVSPVGTAWPFFYSATNPKFDRQRQWGSPETGRIQPPPVTKPAFGSYTTTYWYSSRCDPFVVSVQVPFTVYTPVAV